jgi:hypothetical protein
MQNFDSVQGECVSYFTIYKKCRLIGILKGKDKVKFRIIFGQISKCTYILYNCTHSTYD